MNGINYTGVERITLFLHDINDRGNNKIFGIKFALTMSLYECASRILSNSKTVKRLLCIRSNLVKLLPKMTFDGMEFGQFP
jgi:hypothetical protein